MPETTDVTMGELNETIEEINPVPPKDERTTGREIPMEATVLTAKAESELQREFIEIETPTVATGDTAAVPSTRPYTTVIAEPVKGKVTTDMELTKGVSVEKAEESRPTEAAET